MKLDCMNPKEITQHACDVINLSGRNSAFDRKKIFALEIDEGRRGLTILSVYQRSATKFLAKCSFSVVQMRRVVTKLAGLAGLSTLGSVSVCLLCDG